MGLLDKFRRGVKQQDHSTNQDPHTELNGTRGYEDLKQYQAERRTSENSIEPDK